MSEANSCVKIETETPGASSTQDNQVLTSIDSIKVENEEGTSSKADSNVYTQFCELNEEVDISDHEIKSELNDEDDDDDKNVDLLLVKNVCVKIETEGPSASSTQDNEVLTSIDSIKVKNEEGTSSKADSNVNTELSKLNEEVDISDHEIKSELNDDDEDDDDDKNNETMSIETSVKGQTLINKRKKKFLSDDVKAVIASVYHYLQDEVRFIRTYEHDADLKYLFDVCKRTAEATGVSIRTVNKIICAERKRKLAATPENVQGASPLLTSDTASSAKRAKTSEMHMTRLYYRKKTL